ncbi:V-type ATP synthase subunit D [Streptococcus urinalis FB127-CNA-2]|uniref:V-type ATP synthase subunit D n=1 Tax=Streptococcus urinalis 2285-97 TaxID=764291 RepID=G5KHB1_9STRE|nr:V-type ATP synthase subunit D [Streptococcus urinalis]EHJ57658.1 V-type ATPase, D subunit [Streptococcus urinalis 2285-97]EKS21094.1 V-type ATP synthase subunit D [Streptococcus urinalis FB127-CNA-2]VEF31103.1 V-type ATP synthase subunit D [Streptococcus urinalis]
MARLNVKPTRMELSNLKTRLKTATRGHKLLKDKRDELMRHFVDLIKENNDLRQEVERDLASNMQDFVLAKSQENDLMVEELFAVPFQEVDLFIETENIMSVNVPKFHVNTNQHDDNKGEFSYSFLSSNSEMDETISKIESLQSKMLRLAEVEKTCQLMADEIEKTRRRVNGLEYAIIPQLEETIHYIELKLEEAERANLVRIMKVK